MNKKKKLSGGGKNLTGGGKWGWRGWEVGGGKWGERGREVGIGYHPCPPPLYSVPSFGNSVDHDQLASDEAS